MYLVMACVPAVFNIGPALDENGNPQIPKAEFTGDSIVRYVFLGTSIRTVAMWLTLHQASQAFQVYNQATVWRRSKVSEECL